MDITISVSKRICEFAERNGKDIVQFVEEILEEKEREFPKDIPDEPHPLLKFAGIFSSGKTDTSRRYKEILMEDIDKRGGFGGS
ncbi:MAG: hypothetical protein ACR2MG_11970 [Pyrinomonadaceae bacterium]